MRSTFFNDLWEPIRVWCVSLFTGLPAEYGDTTPPELRVFEAQTTEALAHERAAGRAIQPRHMVSKPRKVGSGTRPHAA